jgi:hypothetical protein
VARPLAPLSLPLLGCLVACAPISISPATPVADLVPDPVPIFVPEPEPIEVVAFETIDVGEGVINGTIKNSNSGEPIANALVVLTCTCLSAGQERFTNDRGIYSFRDLPPGEYTIQVLAGKADSSKITHLPAAAKLRANFAINPQQDETRVIVVDAAPLPYGTTSTGVRIDMEEAKKLPVGSSTSRDFTAVVDVAPTASRDSAGISLAGTTGAESHYIIDAAHIIDAADAQASAGTLTVATIDDNRERRSLAELAGQLDELSDLRERGGYAALTGDRTVIRVVDRKGRPIVDAIVRAEFGQSHVTLRTGTDGKAALVPHWDLGVERGKVEVQVDKGGVEREVELKVGDESETIELPMDHDPLVTSLDLALVIDVTGSMGDELTWLQVELHHVIDTVLASRRGLDARFAIIAYRDQGDEFELKTLDFTGDLAKVDEFLGRLQASGGGDYPELMDDALAAAGKLAWREGGAKVTLLLADAPPHAHRVGKLMVASDDLRETGVSTYAIAASGTDSQTELLMRSIAALSAAQYLSLTDDSGVGNPHADPHVPEFTVETLESALLRILEAELDAESAAAPPVGKRRKPGHTVWDLEHSLFDDGGQSELFGGPVIIQDLM